MNRLDVYCFQQKVVAGLATALLGDEGDIENEIQEQPVRMLASAAELYGLCYDPRL